MINHKSLKSTQEVAVKQAEVKAATMKAKSDIVAKAWTQTVKLKAPSSLVSAPLWGSYGAGGGGPAIGTPLACWTTGADAEGAWPGVEVEVGAWKEEEVEVGALKEDKVEEEEWKEFETEGVQAETDHEMRILNDRVTPSAIYLNICSVLLDFFDVKHIKDFRITLRYILYFSLCFQFV